MLSTYVPDLEVHVWKRDCGDILTHGRDRLEFGRRLRREEVRFDLLVESRLARIVQAEKKDGVFCQGSQIPL